MRKVMNRWRLHLAESDLKSPTTNFTDTPEEPVLDPKTDNLQKALDVQSKLRDELEWNQEKSELQKQWPEDAWEQQGTRDKIYTAYESGLPRDVYEKYIEREVEKGKIDLGGSESVTGYYDEKILPRIKDHVYKTPVYPKKSDPTSVEYPVEAPAYYASSGDGPGEIYKDEEYETPEKKERWESDVFPHELVHAVQDVVPPSDISKGEDMSYRQFDDLKALFPDLTRKQDDTHHKRAREIHDAIILSRIKDLPGQPVRALSADDIKFLRTANRRGAGPEDLKGVYDSDLGRAIRDKTFLNPNLTDQEIADIINRIAKTERKNPKTRSTA